MTTAVDLLIDRIVLAEVGLEPAQAGALGRLVERELGELLERAGRPLDPRRAGLTEAAPMSLAAEPDVRVLARELAERLAGQLGVAAGGGSRG